MKRLLTMITDVDTLRERMERLLRRQRRVQAETTDDKVNHLRPCAACHENYTRFGICIECVDNTAGNGHQA